MENHSQVQLSEILKARLPLDPALYHLSSEEQAFLRETISPDDEAVKKAVFEIQKEYVVQY